MADLLKFLDQTKHPRCLALRKRTQCHRVSHTLTFIVKLGHQRAMALLLLLDSRFYAAQSPINALQRQKPIVRKMVLGGTIELESDPRILATLISSFGQ